MFRSSRGVFILPVLFIVAQSITADGQSSKPVESNVIELEGNHYRLIIQDDNLVLSRLAKDKEQPSLRPLRFAPISNGRITAMRLEPWIETGLCAVVEVKIGERYEYSLLTMSAPLRSPGYDNASAVIFTSSERHSILALNGTYDGDTVITVLGVAHRGKGGLAVERGVVAIDVCPLPPTEGGQTLSKFKTSVQNPSLQQP